MYLALYSHEKVEWVKLTNMDSKVTVKKLKTNHELNFIIASVTIE